MTHFLGDHLLLFERSAGFFLPSPDEQDLADKKSELRQRPCIATVEMAFRVTNDPQRSQLFPGADGEGDEQNLRQDEVFRCNPIISALGMSDQDWRVGFERYSAGTVVARGGRTFKAGQRTMEVLPAKYVRFSLFVENAEASRHRAGHFHRQFDEAR